MSARVLQVAHINASCDYWRGHGSRELLLEVGCVPLWGSRVRAWSCGPWRTPDAIALWESRGGRVEFVDEIHLLRLAGHELDALKAAHAESRGMLL